MNFLKGKPPAARKDLNLDKLMLAELRGIDKRVEIFNAEDSSNPGFPSDQEPQESKEETDLWGEGEDEEEYLPKKIKTAGRSHPQPSPTHRRMSKQVEGLVGNSQRIEESAAKLAWFIQDNHKGQALLAL